MDRKRFLKTVCGLGVCGCVASLVDREALAATPFQWNKEKGIVTVAVAEGECGCPLVDARRTPAFFCNCSVGYQKESFAAVFGRPVQAALKESKLGGSKRCVFEITLAAAPDRRG